LVFLDLDYLCKSYKGIMKTEKNIKKEEKRKEKESDRNSQNQPERVAQPDRQAGPVTRSTSPHLFF
jgi:hypothetical protein